MDIVLGEVDDVDEYLSVMIDSLESKVANIKQIHEGEE